MESQQDWLTINEAAKLLGISAAAVSNAVRQNRLPSQGPAWGSRVNVGEVLAYGIRTGKDPEELVTRLQEIREEASLGDILGWFLIGLGLIWLFKKLGE